MLREINHSPYVTHFVRGRARIQIQAVGILEPKFHTILLLSCVFGRNYFTCLSFHFLTYKHGHNNSTYNQVVENIPREEEPGAVSTQEAKGSSDEDYCKGQDEVSSYAVLRSLELSGVAGAGP